jgi:hypothetical protein
VTRHLVAPAMGLSSYQYIIIELQLANQNLFKYLFKELIMTADLKQKIIEIDK